MRSRRAAPALRRSMPIEAGMPATRAAKSGPRIPSTTARRDGCLKSAAPLAKTPEGRRARAEEPPASAASGPESAAANLAPHS